MSDDQYRQKLEALRQRQAAEQLRQQQADAAYWLRAEKNQQHLLLKHSMSGAADAMVKVEVDQGEHAIYAEVDDRERGRIPVSLIAHYVCRLEHEGIVAYDDDNSGSWECKRTSWRIVIKSGTATYRLRITKQLDGIDFDLIPNPTAKEAA